MKSLWKSVSFGFIFLGVFCFVMEALFYNGVDEKGILQESFFLPLGYLFVFSGLIFLAFHWIGAFGKRMKKSS
ncbi:MAG: DUF3955 domain-containing protein [Cohaesibacter sp.]|nr:DUF3955 domain-containing protein [Cohaesibacter sp.]MCV6601534.1 DUF3955 domain-containing protein [Cohaesibacter sp.]